MKIAINRDSLEAAFPMPVPPLLLVFADWLETVPHGGVGYFDALASEPLNEAFPDPRLTPEICNKLALFLYLPDGSRLALWDHGADEPAVVLLGSEGELENVAASLAAFLVALSQGDTGVNDLDEDGPEPRRDELAKWLANMVETPNEKRAVASVPDFGEWYEARLDGRGGGA